MNPGELLSMITAKSAPFERMPTGIPAMTRSDVAAALGLVKHPYASIYCRVKYADQDVYWDQLILAAKIEIDYLWCEQGWPFPKGWDRISWIDKITTMALREHIYPHTCVCCGGTGFNIIKAKQIRQRRRKRNVKIGQVIECQICKGTGMKKPTGRSRAKAVDMAHTTWAYKWEDRYKDVLIVLDRVESIGLGSIAKRLRQYS